MAFNVNPLMAEYAAISPGLKAAMTSAGQAPPMNPPVITPQMKADVQPVNAGPAPEISGIHMPDAPTPQLGAPHMPDVSGPILGTTQGDTLNRESLLQHGPAVDHIASRIEGSGFGQNHPVLGKILGVAGEVGGKIGDTLSNAFPGIGREIPGTTQNYNQQLKGANANLTQDESNAGKEAQTASENSTAGKTTEETAEMPGKTQSEEGLQGAQKANLESETTDRDKAANAPSFTVHDTEEGPILVGKDGTAQHLSVDGQPVGPKLNLKESQPIIGADGKPHTYMLDDKGNKKVDLGVHYERPAVSVNTGEKEGQNFFVPDGQGGTKMIRVKPGDAVPAGAQSASGLNAVNTPTNQQRTAAGRAETVVAMAPEVLSRIDALAPKMGPIAGRWNDFMQGKVGSDDPDFAGLRSDLLMMSSAVALAHAQGRLPENLRLEFDHAINAPKQTPANLKSTITTMLPWLQKMQSQGQPNAPKGNETASAPQRPAGVPENYVWNQQGNSGKGSWKAPQ